MGARLRFICTKVIRTHTHRSNGSALPGKDGTLILLSLEMTRDKVDPRTWILALFTELFSPFLNHLRTANDKRKGKGLDEAVAPGPARTARHRLGTVHFNGVCQYLVALAFLFHVLSNLQRDIFHRARSIKSIAPSPLSGQILSVVCDLVQPQALSPNCIEKADLSLFVLVQQRTFTYTEVDPSCPISTIDR